MSTEGGGKPAENSEPAESPEAAVNSDSGDSPAPTGNHETSGASGPAAAEPAGATGAPEGADATDVTDAAGMAGSAKETDAAGETGAPGEHGGLGATDTGAGAGTVGEPDFGGEDGSAGQPDSGGDIHATGGSPAEGATAQSPVSAEAAHDAQISAAGGVVVGESELAGQADRSRVRRAPRYRRFAVLGGLLGLVVTAVITPFASTSEFVDSGDIFLMLALTLVPLGILVTCGIAMLTDSAARKRK